MIYCVSLLLENKQADVSREVFLYIAKVSCGAVAEYREQLKMLICQAFQKGFSLFEIVRITGARNPNFAYNALRNEKLFPRMARGKPKRTALLDTKIENIFLEKGFTFAKWANMWKFSQDDVARALSAENDENSAFQDIYAAFQRDFPDHFTRLFTHSALNRRETIRLQRGVVPKLESLVVLLRYDEDFNQFTATFTTLPSMEGQGQTWAAAITDLEKIWWVHKAITRLNLALYPKQAAASFSERQATGGHIDCSRG